MAQAKKKVQESRWTDVSGTIRVMGFENKVKRGGKTKTFVTWSTSIGNKFDDDEDWTNYRVNVTFAKACGEPDGAGPHDIMIESGFLTLERWENKDGDLIVKPKLVITGYAEEI